MQLITLGHLALEGATKKLSPQVLLLLSYARLTGTRSRSEWAEMIWSHLAGEFTSKGERKDMKNLGVALASLRQGGGIDLEDEASLLALTCDVTTFTESMTKGAYSDALTLFEAGTFLQDIEHKPRLKLSSNLYNWIMTQREVLSSQAQQAHLQLAEKAAGVEDFAAVHHHAREALGLMGEVMEPGLLTRLHRLLLLSGSDLAAQVRQTFETFIDDALAQGLIGEEGLELFLALSLQEVTNLAAAQKAANLSPKMASLCLEDLISAKVIGAGLHVLAGDIAQNYLEHRPAKRMALLMALREHTPPAEAFGVYRAIYRSSHTFGGMGYWRKARSAYYQKAKASILEEAYSEALTLLTELQQAEESNQEAPEARVRFLHGYALERLRHFREGLQVLEGVEETPDIIAIKAALLLAVGKHSEAQVLGERVLDEVLSSDENTWARAIAANMMGQLAYSQNQMLKAEMHFDDAAVQWQLAGVPQREIGALMNRANVFSLSNRVTQAQSFYQEIADKTYDYPVLQVRALVNLGVSYAEQALWAQALIAYERAQQISEGHHLEARDALLIAQLFNNRAYAKEQCGEVQEAAQFYKEAMRVAHSSGQRAMYAAALGNLGALQREAGKLASALNLLTETGHALELHRYERLYQQVLISLALEQIDAGTPQAAHVYIERFEHHLSLHPNPSQPPIHTLKQMRARLDSNVPDDLLKARRDLEVLQQNLSAAVA